MRVEKDQGHFVLTKHFSEDIVSSMKKAPAKKRIGRPAVGNVYLNVKVSPEVLRFLKTQDNKSATVERGVRLLPEFKSWAKGSSQ